MIKRGDNKVRLSCALSCTLGKLIILYFFLDSVAMNSNGIIDWISRFGSVVVFCIENFIFKGLFKAILKFETISTLIKIQQGFVFISHI